MYCGLKLHTQKSIQYRQYRNSMKKKKNSANCVIDDIKGFILNIHPCQKSRHIQYTQVSLASKSLHFLPFILRERSCSIMHDLKA